MFVYLDQIRRCYLFIQQPETMHQECMIGSRHPRGYVVPDGIVPTEHLGQAKHRREIDAYLPFGRTGFDCAFRAFE